jgi:hypothetical protein
MRYLEDPISKKIKDADAPIRASGKQMVISTTTILTKTICADQPYILSWPMVISNSVNEFFVAV